MLARLLWPVWNAEERRPRALVRIAVHAVLVTLVLVLIGRFSPWWRGTPWGIPLAFGLETAGVFGVTWLAARALDRRPFAALGLMPRPGYALDLALGVLIGGACMGAIALVEIAFGWASYAPRIDAWGEIAPATGRALVVFGAIAIVEEVISRGYHLVNLAEGLACGPVPRPRAVALAVALSSAGFGLAHAWNPSATLLSTALIACGGVLLAVGFLTQGDLAIPIGVHFGWNYFQNLFDMPVSGQDDYAGAAIVVRTELGPDLATGGAFGPEGGLTGLGGMLLGIALTLAWVRARQGRLSLAPRLGLAPLEGGTGREGLPEGAGQEVDGAPAA
jgi:membrane protease YdiL (CAAX protease family)